MGSGDQLIPDLQAWAKEYADASGGQLNELPYRPNNPERYPGQVGFSVHGNPQSAAVVDSIANIAHPKYGDISELLGAQEATAQVVSRIGELLRAGNNVILATNHSDLIDIAVTHAAFYSQLDRLGYEMKTGIIISKMIAFLAYKLGEDTTPAVGILKLLENEQFLSYPRTESARKREVGKFVPREIDRHNWRMRNRVQQRLGEGAMLLAIAASGTTDKPRPDDPDTIIMSPIGLGTSKLMQSEKTYVVPVAVWYGCADPVFEVCDIPHVIESDEMADNVMSKIAKTLTTRIPGKTVVYTAN